MKIYVKDHIEEPKFVVELYQGHNFVRVSVNDTPVVEFLDYVDASTADKPFLYVCREASKVVTKLVNKHNL